MIMHRWFENQRLARIATLGVLVALVVFHAVNNWLWLQTNVTILGWDVPSHLGTSFIYDTILRPLSPKTLFTAVTWHPNRPPLYFLSAVPLYRLFGLSSDVGTMVNVVYLTVLFGSVYGIGRRLGGRRVGLLAAFVVATLPMVYALSRYFYLELALTAIVALSVYLLLASDGFESRATSLLFGLCFGLGLLTKRTYLAFVFAPVCVVLIRSEALASLRRRLRSGLHLEVKDVLLALGLGLALSAAWYLPGREIANHLPLGGWLVPLWAVLIAATIYFLRLQPGPDTNFLSALFLGGTLGSLWYLPRITFIERLLRFGFGVNDPWERTANLDRLDTYGYFLVQMITEHLSPVYFIFLAIAVLALLLYLWRKGDMWDTLRRASDAWWVTALWVIGSYALLTLSVYRKSRGITPVLPALALILAAGLFRLPWKRGITILVVLLVGWGLMQFVVLSFEAPHWIADRTTLTLPGLGEVGLFARGGAHLLPDDGETDRNYWVVPDIMEIVEADRLEAGTESSKLGVLVNNEHVNPDLFGLMALQGYPAIQVQNLARSGIPDSLVSHLFEYDYLVMIEENYKWIDDAAQEALRHLDESPGLFDATFELDREFPLPDGDTVLLYRKARHPVEGYDLADYQAVAQTLATTGQEADAILIVPPDQAEAIGRTYDGPLTPYLLPRGLSLEPEATAKVLEEMVARHPVVFAIFRGEQSIDPDGYIEGWLNEHTYRGQTEWHGGVRLVTFGASLADAGGSLGANDGIENSLDIRLGEQVKLLGYELGEDWVEAGRMVRLILYWETSEPLAERLTVFAHVLGSDGQLVAQQDSQPRGGSRPTSTWAVGEVIPDPIGILIPAGTPSGEYQIVVGMYHPGTGERLPVVVDGIAVAAPSLEGGDNINLGMIQVK